MRRYIGRRLLTGLLVVAIVLILNFLLINIAPGDPIRMLAGKDNPSPQMIAALQEKYGLDKPLYIQLITYIKTLLKGDLGYSILSNSPVSKMISERLGATALLTLTSIIIAVILGTLLGLYAARYRDSKMDKFLSYVTYTFYSMPSFWLALMGILVFSSWLKILPTSGMYDLRAPLSGIGRTLDLLKHMVLPVGTLTIVEIPIYFMIFRTSMTQIMSEDFITTFRATGMSEKKIFNKYIFKNAILPTITVLGINLAYIITGAALIETVFSWPGTGRLMLEAIMRRDYPLLMGIYLILSISIALIMVVVDIIYAYIDPRIRYQ